jgi:dTMP kinase
VWDVAEGRFIVFEGGDGSGKTTQVKALVAALRIWGYDPVVHTREPGGTELGERIRALLLHWEDVSPRAEALLYAADRAQHVAQVIRPTLARGGIVVSDRFVDSSIAYQGEGRDLPEDVVRAINLFATSGLTPDVTFLLDISAGAAAQRRSVRRGEDRIEAAGAEFHQRVNARYAALAAAEPKRYVVIDASGSAGEVHAAVLNAVAPFLPQVGQAGGGA